MKKKIKRVLGWIGAVILYVLLHVVCLNSTSGGALPPSMIPVMLDIVIVFVLIIAFFAWAFGGDETK